MARRVTSRIAGTGRYVSKSTVARSPGRMTTERVGSGTSKGRTVNRSASTGKFVTKETAVRDPGGSTREARAREDAVLAALEAGEERTPDLAGYIPVEVEQPSRPATAARSKSSARVQIQAARLREATDRKLGKTTPEWVRRLARKGEPDDQREGS